MTEPAAKSLSPRQIERRQRILDRAISLVGALGYDAVTMRMIAQDSGTAEKTLYNIYGTKDRLVALAARGRTADVFVLTARREPRHGWPRLSEFARTAAEVTLETPVLSRALAAVLVDHAELVGLHDVYEAEVGAILQACIDDGTLQPDAPLSVLVRNMRLGAVSVIFLWAKQEIGDAELEACLLMRCAETLLPFASPDGAAILREAAWTVARTVAG